MAEKMLLAFGRYLKLVRERRKLSLEDVATLTKSYPEPINKGYLSRVERGLARVGFSKMVALSHAYEVSLDAFGEKLALDLEVDDLRDAPDTRTKTFRQMRLDAFRYSQQGLRWHAYVCVRDALARAHTDPLYDSFFSREEQVITATMSHGVAVRGLGRLALALTEFEYVREHAAALSAENLPIVFQQLATIKRHLGRLEEAETLAQESIELAERSPLRKHLGDALDNKAQLVAHTSLENALEVFQRAFAAYKSAGREVDCARVLNNVAQIYFLLGRIRAARRSLAASDRLATKLDAHSVKSRARLLLGEIAHHEGNRDVAARLWHESLEIARKSHDSVVLFKAEFQLFKLAIETRSTTSVNALGRRLSRMTPWIPKDEPELAEFRQLYAIHRKPKQRSVARSQQATT